MFKFSDPFWLRVAPMLSFSFLFPIFFLTAIVHEVGHGIIGLVIGGKFIAIELYRDATFIHIQFDTQPNPVNYSVFLIAGIITQYAFGLITLVAVRRLRPKKFLPNSLALWVIIQNFVAPSMSIGSLQGDFQNLVNILVNAGIEVAPILLQVSSLALVLVTFYVCERQTEAFLGIAFNWLKRTRIRVVATLTVIFYISITIINFFAKFSYPLYFLAIALGITTLCLTIPPQLQLDRPSIQQNQNFSLKDVVLSSLFFSSINAFYLFSTPFFISPYI